MSYFRKSQKGLLLNIKVAPKASANKIVRWENNALKVLVTATPDKNLANRSVIELLSKTLKVAKGNIEIARGAKQKEKVLLFINQELSILEEKLKAHLEK